MLRINSHIINLIINETVIILCFYYYSSNSNINQITKMRIRYGAIDKKE